MRSPHLNRVHRWRAPAWLLLLVIAGCGQNPTAPPPARPLVDGKKAFARVAEFAALGPRPAGSPGAKRAAHWLEDVCRKIGVKTHVEQWRGPTPAGSKTFRNVHAVLPGRLPGRILVGSHYDTKVLADAPGFIGANDSCSSTGLLIELIRILHCIDPWPGTTIEFVFFDGEECLEQYGPEDGLHGSRHFADQIKKRRQAADWRAVILLDMVGDHDFGLTLSTDTPGKLALALFDVAEAQGVRDRVGYFTSGTILDDHTPFQRLGIPAIDLIDFEYGPGNTYWHTRQDTLDKLSPKSLATAGNLCLGLVWRLSFQPD